MDVTAALLLSPSTQRVHIGREQPQHVAAGRRQQSNLIKMCPVVALEAQRDGPDLPDRGGEVQRCCDRVALADP